MKTIKLALVALVFSSHAAFAGGFLTNTNQSVLFLRNPARDAAIGIDGVYTNPAGVAFMADGWHLSFNWQNAHQTRTINSAYGPLFALNTKNPAALDAEGLAWREFKGVADAPFLPSLQAAYNKNRWSFQFNVAVSGGGGKCEFENGLGSFEGVVASMVPRLNDQLASAVPGVTPFSGYNLNSYMKGQQYYFGATLGAAYKVTENLSVYGGVRFLYGTANYQGYVKDINLVGPYTLNNDVTAHTIFGELKNRAATGAQQAAAGAAAAAQAGNADLAAYYQGLATGYAATAQQMGAYEIVTQGINLDCDQSGFGIAPIVGVDYKLGRLNLAAKFDFKVRMRLKNSNPAEGFNVIAQAVPQLAKYADGNVVAEDSPALFTFGAQYELTDKWRVMAGYHHFFDVDTKQWTKNLISDTNEFNVGTEYDITDWLQVSGGLQKTNYDMEEDFMNDISFNVSSYTFGLGFGVKVADNVKINAAYFQTNYDTYKKTEQMSANTTSSATLTVKNNFTRTNRVFGVGVEWDF